MQEFQGSGLSANPQNHARQSVLLQFPAGHYEVLSAFLFFIQVQEHPWLLQLPAAAYMC